MEARVEVVAVGQVVAVGRAGWAEEAWAPAVSVCVLSAGHEPPISRAFHVLNRNVQIAQPLW